MLPFLAVTFLSLVVVACGGDEGASSNDAPSDDPAPTAQESPEIDAGEPSVDPGGGTRASGSTSTSVSPELTACMAKAGFHPSAPAHGMLADWQHGDNARSRVVVAADSGAALELAGTVGTAEAPANVEGDLVTVGAEDEVAAALACLDAG